MVSLHPSLFWTEVDVDLLHFQYDVSVGSQIVWCHVTVHSSVVHRQDVAIFLLVTSAGYATGHFPDIWTNINRFLRYRKWSIYKWSTVQASVLKKNDSTTSSYRCPPISANILKLRHEQKQKKSSVIHGRFRPRHEGGGCKNS